MTNLPRHIRHERTTARHAIGILVVLAPLALAPLVVAESLGLAGAVLPLPVQGTSAAWAGGKAFTFGGVTSSGFSNAIGEYDPASDTAAQVGTLPHTIAYSSAVSDGTFIFVFEANAANHIQRYDPATGNITAMGATLNVGDGTSAVWADGVAYVFGGSGAGTGNWVNKYDPVADTFTNLGATVPFARWSTSAVWTGSVAYIFGGAYTTDEILRFDPATNELTVMNARLPTPRYGTSAYWDGNRAYVFGGFGPDTLAEIVQYDPATDTAALMCSQFGGGRGLTSAAGNGDTAWIFGGNSGGSLTSSIFRFRGAPLPPTDLSATRSVALATIHLSWTAPPAEACSPATQFKVYRGTAPGEETFLGTVPASQTSFDDAWLPDLGWAGPPPRPYYYIVRSNSAAGESSPSNEAHCDPLLAAPPLVGSCA